MENQRPPNTLKTERILTPAGKPVATIRTNTRSGVQTGYATHFGVLGFASLNLIANLDGFVLVQYKRLNRDVTPVIDDIHGYLGAMFRF